MTNKIKKGVVLGALIGVLFFSGIIDIYTVHAATDPAAGSGSDALVNVIDPKFQEQLNQSFGKELATFINNVSIGMTVILKMLYALLIPLLVIIGKFLSNDWVTGNTFNVDVVIEVAWGYVRNLVNIAMMFYLLYIAGANILFGYGGSIPPEAQIKKILPQVAAVLILVNFSMLFCRTIINIAGVATTGAFGIVQQSGQLFEDKSDNFFPFIWAENLGTNTTVIYDKNKNVKTSDVDTLNTGTDKTKFTNTYALECIHKNYAISFKSLNLTGNGGNMIIANPVLDANKNYTTAWYHNYRILASYKEKKDPNDWQKKIDAVKKNASPTNGYVASEEEFKKATDVGGSTDDKRTYPYYSDCVTSWNDAFFSARNAMFMFSFNLMKIGEYENGLGNIASFSDLLTRVVISLVYLCVFFFIILALTVAVVLRGVFIWFMMVMSPIWLTLELLKKKDFKGISKSVGTMQSFVKLAFMPAVLGFILSIVFMMINYLKHIAVLEQIDSGLIDLMGVTIYFDANNPVIGGLSTVFEMMIAIVTLISVWFAVQMAFEFGFKDGGFIEKAWNNSGNKILGLAKEIGKDVATMPLHARLIPLGKGKYTSLSAINQAPRDIKTQFDAARRMEDDAARQALLGTMGLTDMKEKVTPDVHTKLNNAMPTITSLDTFQKNVRPILASETGKLEGRQALFDLYDKAKTYTSGDLDWKVGDKTYKITPSTAAQLKNKVLQQDVKALDNQIGLAKGELARGEYTGKNITAILPKLQKALLGEDTSSVAPTPTMNTAGNEITVGATKVPSLSTASYTGKTYKDLFTDVYTLSQNPDSDPTKWDHMLTNLSAVWKVFKTQGIKVEDFYAFVKAHADQRSISGKTVDITKHPSGVPNTALSDKIQ